MCVLVVLDGFQFCAEEILFSQNEWTKEDRHQALHFGEIVTPGGRWDRPERSIGSFLTLARPSSPLSKVATIVLAQLPNEYVLAGLRKAVQPWNFRERLRKNKLGNPLHMRYLFRKGCVGIAKRLSSPAWGGTSSVALPSTGIRAPETE